MRFSSLGRCAPLAMLALAGCAEPRLMNTGQVEIVSPSDLPPPAERDLNADTRRHIIGPFDRLSVEVFGLPELSRQVQVDAQGNVALPLAGSINAGGRSPEELAAAVTERLRGSYVRNPQVTVGVVETVSQTVTVDGEVRLPGVYPVLGRSTLMRSVARAQGTTETARASFVVVFRNVQDRRMAALYDLRAIRLGAYADPQIYPNDVIVVGESNARRVFPQILQGASLLLTPFLTVLR